MVTMGSTWDRTSEVLAGRGPTLAGIAIPTILLPMIVSDAFSDYATPDTPGFAAIGGLLSVLVLVLAVWGQLAIIAAASEPGTDRGAAFRIGASRLLPAIGVSVVMLLGLAVSVLPAFALAAAAGLDFKAMSAGQAPAPGSISGGYAALGVCYVMLWSLALLWIGAKLALWQAVLVNERNGLRSLVRSWVLTSGSTWRIVGVLALFVIVLLVAVTAAQAVTGIVFRLILGADNIATAVFLAGIAASIVSTAFAVIATVFLTQLYRALAGARPAQAGPASA